MSCMFMERKKNPARRLTAETDLARDTLGSQKRKAREARAVSKRTKGSWVVLRPRYVDVRSERKQKGA